MLKLFDKKQRKEEQENEEVKALYEEGQKLLEETYKFLDSLQTKTA